MYSIVMPVLLREKEHEQVVRETIASIKEAIDVKAELVIINDGSPLKALFLEKEADTYYLVNRSRGISWAWNKGMELALYDKVCIVNDDIKVPKGFLPIQASSFDNPLCGVSAPMVGNPTEVPAIFEGFKSYTDRVFYPGYCFMLDRNIFYEPFDEEFTTNCGDTDYWYRIEKKGLELYRAPFSVWHKEGDVLGKMNYKKLSQESIERFEKKWNFNPQKRYYS